MRLDALKAGVTVPAGDPQDAAVCLLVGAAIAGHQDIVDVRNCHMPMGEVPKTLVLFCIFLLIF